MKLNKDFTRSGGFKIFLLVVLILLFLIPVSMIRRIIEERNWRAGTAEGEIMESWGAEFLVLGPALRIPAQGREEVLRGEKGQEKWEVKIYDFYLWIVPETLSVRLDLGTEVKKRGIFSVPLFAGTLSLQGTFDPAGITGGLEANQRAFPEEAELVISLASQRGIRGVERASWNGGEISFLPGSRGFGFMGSQGGVYGKAPLKKENGGPEKYSFDIDMNIQGGKSLRMVPMGEDCVFDLTARWPSPSFQGSYLPLSKKIDENGFEAHWEISHLSRNIPLIWTSRGENGMDFSSSLFAVNFFKALDHYDLNIRAVKYALLFIIIPFLCLLLFEIFTGNGSSPGPRFPQVIHPVQYLLCGVGNVVFYLLLLSFSEHFPFLPAYCVSALAVTAMMTLYSRSLLGSWKGSRLMGIIMVFCYAFLYFTLRSEDWALLIGSLGAFGTIGVVMFLTRKVDWYGENNN